MATSPELNDETLDFIFELTKDSQKEQLDAAEAMDAKINQIFAAASVVVGLAAFSRSQTHLPHHYATALWVAAIAYLVVALASGFALWTQSFRVSFGADQTWGRYWASSVRAIKHSTVADIASGYTANRRKLWWKRWAVRLCVLALTVETLAVASAQLISLQR